MIKISCSKPEQNPRVYRAIGRGKTLATVLSSGNEILSAEYMDETINERYGEFVLRSMAYFLHEEFPEVRSAFTDPRLAALGFKPDGNGGMIARSQDIIFKRGGCQ